MTNRQTHYQPGLLSSLVLLPFGSCSIVLSGTASAALLLSSTHPNAGSPLGHGSEAGGSTNVEVCFNSGIDASGVDLAALLDTGIFCCIGEFTALTTGCGC